jgi:hypothetical protein
MTDYEILSALNASISTLWTIFATYVSIVFAFLVAGYLTASELASRIVWVVVTVYTLVALWAIFGLNRTAASLIATSFEIKRAVLESGSSLGWHPIVKTPDLFLRGVPILVTAIAVAAYVGSMVFFFYERKARRSV